MPSISTPAQYYIAHLNYAQAKNEKRSHSQMMCDDDWVLNVDEEKQHTIFIELGGYLLCIQVAKGRIQFQTIQWFWFNLNYAINRILFFVAKTRFTELAMKRIKSVCK